MLLFIYRFLLTKHPCLEQDDVSLKKYSFLRALVEFIIKHDGYNNEQFKKIMLDRQKHQKFCNICFCREDYDNDDITPYYCSLCGYMICYDDCLINAYDVEEGAEPVCLLCSLKCLHCRENYCVVEEKLCSPCLVKDDVKEAIETKYGRTINDFEKHRSFD